MTEVFLERDFDPSLDRAGVIALALDSAGCFDIHRIDWRGSFLSSDGRQMLCWFSAPDMESARIAMREADPNAQDFWPGEVVVGPGISGQDLPRANVIVVRSFKQPVTLQEIQDIEDAGIACLDTRNVRFIRTFFSSDKKRMICFYEAPDAESVRQAQREAGVPFDEAWSFQRYGMEDLPAASR
jgi:hypothetical protein